VLKFLTALIAVLTHFSVCILFAARRQPVGVECCINRSFNTFFSLYTICS